MEQIVKAPCFTQRPPFQAIIIHSFYAVQYIPCQTGLIIDE